MHVKSFELSEWENYYEIIVMIISSGNLRGAGTKYFIYCVLYSKEKNWLRQTHCSGSNSCFCDQSLSPKL